ncbi:MAG: aminotransferase class V-fold PLP-dependent enzyme [Acidobacteria bacterium]|nr:aminotransferase class V-fold PLP-dependent enzyme [Acidobacteriota bacterium]
MNRRSFFTTAAAAGAAAAFAPTAIEHIQAAAKYAEPDPVKAATNEDFWMEARNAFTVDRTIINLNNGGCSPPSRYASEAMARYLSMSDMAPVSYMWRQLDPKVETVRQMLAEDFGCDPEEVAITRNASESLEICQYGIDLERGDEIITTTQDYPRMINTWKQREAREGIVLKQVKFQVPPPSLDYITEQIERAITPRTRIILVCHVTNRTGQVLPVKDICELGRKRGIEVIIDGSHSYAHFPFKRDDLDCDYFGTSLHKWLMAPIGTGFLYVKKEKIRNLWPLMTGNPGQENDIRKFEEIGTHPAANRLAIAEAMTFHQSLGVDRKGARLRYLRERWSRRLEQIKGVGTLTPYEEGQAWGIGLLTVEGMEPNELIGKLWNNHRILTTGIIQEDEFQGVRVSPNIYTTLREIDFFCDAVESIVKQRA